MTINEIQQHLDDMRKYIVKDEKHSYLVIPDEIKRTQVLADIDKYAFDGVTIKIEIIDCNQKSEDHNITDAILTVPLCDENTINAIESTEIIKQYITWRDLYILMMILEERNKHIRLKPYHPVLQYYFF